MRLIPSLLALLATASTFGCAAQTDEPREEPAGVASSATFHSSGSPSLDVVKAGPGLFRVYDEGTGASGSVTIWVLAGTQSYSINASPLVPGGYHTYSLSTSLCGQGITVWVDPFGQVAEAPAGQHILNMTGPCNL